VGQLEEIPAHGADPGFCALWAGVEARHLDLVALPTLAADPLAGMIGGFRRRHPRVTVRVFEPEDAASVAAFIRSGRCEIGLADLPLEDENPCFKRLLDQELLVVLPPRTTPPRSERYAVARLADVPVVATPHGTSTRGDWSTRPSLLQGSSRRSRWRPESARPSSLWCWPERASPSYRDRSPRRQPAGERSSPASGLRSAEQSDSCTGSVHSRRRLRPSSRSPAGARRNFAPGSAGDGHPGRDRMAAVVTTSWLEPDRHFRRGGRGHTSAMKGRA
jgi:hypothetical protein